MITAVLCTTFILYQCTLYCFIYRTLSQLILNQIFSLDFPCSKYWNSKIVFLFPLWFHGRKKINVDFLYSLVIFATEFEKLPILRLLGLFSYCGACYKSVRLFISLATCCHDNINCNSQLSEHFCLHASPHTHSVCHTRTHISFLPIISQMNYEKLKLKSEIKLVKLTQTLYWCLHWAAFSDIANNLFIYKRNLSVCN